MNLQNISKDFSHLYESELYRKLLMLIGSGSEQGIHLKELCKATQLSDRTVRKAIETLRRSGVVICADSINGYYYPVDANELFRYIKQEEHRGKSTLYTLKKAKKLYCEIYEVAR